MIYNAGAYEAVEDEKLKDDDEFRSDYAAMNLHDRDIKKKAKEEGILEGAQQKAIEAAENLLKDGDSPEKVARCIGLPLEKVLELQKEITVQV